MMTEVLLNVASMRYRCTVDGPGLRSVVWVQGCTLCCPGCYNPHMQPHKKAHLLDPNALGQSLGAIPDTEGITIMGGEPFEQARGCALLAQAAQDSGKSVMVFSGYTFNALTSHADPAVQCFLEHIDLLIAGPYIRQLRADLSFWRTSANQTVHFLTDRLDPIRQNTPTDPSGVELSTDGRHISCVGFPKDDDIRWLKNISTLLSKP